MQPQPLLTRSGNDFRALLDHTPGFLAVVREDRILFANRAAADLLGVDSAGELLRVAFSSIIHADYRDVIAEDTGLLVAEAMAVPVKMIRLDGRSVDCDLAAVPVNFNGQTAIAFAARDRTPETLAIQALRAREERLTRIVDAVTDAVITVGLDGRVESLNKAAERVFAVGADQLIGQPIHPMLCPAHNHCSADRLTEDMLSAQARGVIGMGRVVELCRADGSPFPAEMSVSPLHHQGRQLVIVMVRDMTERRRTEQRLETLALVDAVSGLPNRTSLLHRLEGMMADVNHQGAALVVMAVDLDHFKYVNDFYGHSLGDRLLRQIAERLGHDLPADHLLARLGGDEFALACPTRSPEAAIQALRQRVSRALAPAFQIDDYELFVSASMGVIVYPDHAHDVATVLRNVESATYFAKESGRNTCEIYSEKVSDRRAGRVAMETELRKALDRGDLSLEYQPRISLATGAVIGMEALLRWEHSDMGPISPATFIPIAEDTGLIVPMGDWVLETACIQARRWQDDGLGPLSLAVNLAARQFRDAGLVSRVAAVLERTQLPATTLELEITESGLMFDVERVIEVLRDLKQLGVSVAVDDFGTGYSSLSYLKRFPIDVLKIDQSFVRGIPQEAGDVAISTAIVAMAKSLRLRTVAEGVENSRQQEFLAALGCDEVQGYLFSRPLKPAAFARFVADRRRRVERGVDFGD